MIVSRIQLYCDGDHGIPIYFPDDGAIDGSILSPAQVRIEARKDGWGRANDGVRLVDLCPDCLKHHKRSLRKVMRGRAK